MNATTARHVEPDQACAEAVDQARAAAEEDGGSGMVGEHVGIEVESDRVVTHLFDSLSPAYVGWRWAVTVTRAARSKIVTVSESLLLPGPDALLAPAWVPWTERVRPGDLKAGDLMPAGADDERLVPVVAIAGDPGLLDWDEGETWSLGAESGGLPGEAGLAALLPADVEAGRPGSGQRESDQVGEEEAENVTEVARGRGGLGLARPGRVLSAVGRDDAAVRWYTSEQGPKSPLAAAAPAHCLTCGFHIRLSGPLGRVFGVCANEFAPDDGKVVSVDHGCGAHSEGEVAGVQDEGTEPTVDEMGYDMLNTGATVPEGVLETLDHESL